MRSKAPLAMMEQTIMVLVFAIAAALCLWAFAWADGRSVWNESRDQAVFRAENAAEAVKHYRGDFARVGETLGLTGQWDGGAWTVSYDENWQETMEGPAYFLFVRAEETPSPLFGRATVTVTNAAGETLFSIPVSWQEVAENE